MQLICGVRRWSTLVSLHLSPKKNGLQCFSIQLELKMNWNWNFAKATCRPADLGSVRLSTKPATGALFTFRYNRQLQVLLISHSFLTWPKLDRTMFELRRYKNTKTTSKWPQALPKHPQPPWQDFCSLLAGRKKTQSTLKRLQSKRICSPVYNFSITWPTLAAQRIMSVSHHISYIVYTSP